MGAIPSSLTSPIISYLPNSLMNGVTSYNTLLNGSNPTAGGTGLLTGLPQAPQYFFTVPFANNQPVLYQLQIYFAGQQIPPFIFPLTPNNVSKQVMNLTNYFDVNSPNPSQLGVQRIIDIFGLTPPIITISGTTGFQFHSLDNYQWSGKSSFALLVTYIQTFLNMVTQVASSTTSAAMPTMTFTDGFTGEAFDVVPFGQNNYNMDSGKPIYQNYNIQFIARTSSIPVSVNITQEDPIAQAFILTRAFLTSAILTTVNSLFVDLPGSNIQ